MTLAFGNRSRSSCSRFAGNSVVRKLIPVTFPPGRLRLATRPAVTGSSPVTNTTGIVDVAALAARAVGGPPAVASTLTCCRTSSAAKAGSRSSRPCAHRVFQRQVLTYDVAALSQTPAEGGYETCTRLRKDAAQKSHHRHCWLLRARNKGPRRCTAERSHELSPSDVDCHVTSARGHARAMQATISRFSEGRTMLCSAKV